MNQPDTAPAETEAEGLPPAGKAVLAASGAAGAQIPEPSVPDYELLRRIAAGAYGEVWLARSQATGMLRAAKIVWRHRFEDERPFRREFEGIQRFERISREHPSQLALFHIGRNDAQGYFYYVMELADGWENPNAESRSPKEGRSPKAEGTPATTAVRASEFGLPSAFGLRPSDLYIPHTLRADLAQGRLPAARVLEIGLALAEALSHLHRHSLVHRDVKPSNVIFVDGRPKLADIGLVTDASDQCSIVGTEGYLPPEGPGTPQADIFALGKVLYEASTGMDRREFPKLPDDLRAWPDARQVFELNEVLLKACAADPGQRYVGANAMLAELALLHSGQSVRDKYALERRLKLTRQIALAVAAVLALGVIPYSLAIREAHVAMAEAARAKQAEREQSRLRSAEQQARQTAQKNERIARQRAYAAGMNLVARALDDKQFSVAADLLNRQRPQPGQEDLRGWEWRYAWQQARSDATCQLCKRPDAISSLALSSDGKWLAVGEHSQGGVSIWDLSRKQEVSEWKGGEGEAICAFCPTKPTMVFTAATRIGATNWSNGLRIWDIGTRQRLGGETSLSAYCRALAFSSDGRTLAAATCDDRITLFRFPEMAVLAAFPAHLSGRDPPMGFALSSDARFAAFAAPGGRLTLMDLRSGRERWTVQTPDDLLGAAAISADGSLVASHGGDVRLWDAATGAEIARQDGWGFSLAFGKSGSTMAVSWGENLRFWNVSDRVHWRAKTRMLHGLTGEIWTLVLLPDESTVVTGSSDGAVTLWDAAAIPEEPDAGTLPPEVRAWRFSHDTSAIVALDKQGEVARWQGRGFRQKQGLFSVGTNIFRAKFSEDADFLAVAPTNGLVEVWDVARSNVIGRVFSTIPEFEPTVPGLLFLAGGKRLLVLDRFENVHEWDFRAEQETASWPLSSSWTVALTPDERSCLSVGQSGSQWIASLKHWPGGTQTNKALNLKYIEEARFSPDGRLFAAASSAIGVGLWDAATLEEAVPLEVSTSESRFSVDFSPDGTRLAVGGGWTHAVQLFDVASGQLVFNIGGVGNMFWPIRFSPDGNVLATVNHQGVLYFWRAPTTDEIKAKENAAQAQ